MLVKIAKLYRLLCIPQVLFNMAPRNNITDISYTQGTPALSRSSTTVVLDHSQN